MAWKSHDPADRPFRGAASTHFNDGCPSPLSSTHEGPVGGHSGALRRCIPFQQPAGRLSTITTSCTSRIRDIVVCVNAEFNGCRRARRSLVADYYRVCLTREQVSLANSFEFFEWLFGARSPVSAWRYHPLVRSRVRDADYWNARCHPRFFLLFINARSQKRSQSGVVVGDECRDRGDRSIVSYCLVPRRSCRPLPRTAEQPLASLRRLCWANVPSSRCQACARPARSPANAARDPPTSSASTRDRVNRGISGGEYNVTHIILPRLMLG